ncbi:putative sodium-dependent multivitamin transporter [Trichonephila clavata]|uniref:Putative sodium-dependent multivitamin transporter n=1 Tax=Trichonephila clavata TaxID=2740835 RepID=A0A8X6L702_TRICU|nr:putative sodium-dependent multivitamin transporter [Trichonephila clavata]
MTSAISMVGFPSEIYKYGLQPIVRNLGMPIGIALAAYVFIPVYFQCGVSTVYEFLEIRYGKITRYVVSALFILQMVLYMSSVLYAPVLALNAVTDLSIELSIIVFGAICTFYCAMGGLKAVLWSDVFQFNLMFITIMALYIAGIREAGGLAQVYDTANSGSRLNMFDFRVDLTTRYTFLNCLLQGIMYGFGCYGTSQIEVQRLLSLSNVKRAKSTLLISILPVTGLYLLCNLYGLILYSVYYLCDPISNKKVTGLTKYDQLVPYFLVSKFHSIPGLTGLCMAGIFSGSLSTVSSALNSLATVTVVDFIHPLFSSIRSNEAKSVFIAKTLSFCYGFICICLAFALLHTSSIKQVSNLVNSTVDGPVAAIFTLGILTTKCSGKNVLFGLLAGVAVTSWIGYGTLFSGYIQASLPMNTSKCATSFNFTETVSYTIPTYLGFENISSSTSSMLVSQSDIFILYKVSYYWIRPIGFITTIFFTFLAVCLTGWKAKISLVGGKNKTNCKDIIEIS